MCRLMEEVRESIAKTSGRRLRFHRNYPGRLNILLDRGEQAGWELLPVNQLLLQYCTWQSIDAHGTGLTCPKDLVQWTFVNELLTLQPSGELGPSRVVERPHIIYNSATSKYVMWLHIDSSSYGEAKAGVATSSSVCGDYTYL